MFLSPKSFEPYTNLKSKDSVRDDNNLSDIKIDVYYNGALLSSKTVKKEFAGSKHLNKEQIVRISGLPTGKQSERALSLVPPGQSPDGKLQMNTRNKESSLNRWRKISRMLDFEALRLPTSSATIADGLRGLSKLEMPGEIIRMHKAGRTYSVIDVIATSGNLQETIKPPLSESQELTILAQNTEFVTPETSARRNATLQESVERSRPFLGKSSSSPSHTRRVQTSNRRPAIGYFFTAEPPQPTVEQQFRAIQEAAESPTRTLGEERKVTKRARLTRNQTPALVNNHVSPAPNERSGFDTYKNPCCKDKVENHGGLDARSESPKKANPAPEPITPKAKDCKSSALPCPFPRLFGAAQASLCAVQSSLFLYKMTVLKLSFSDTERITQELLNTPWRLYLHRWLIRHYYLTIITGASTTIAPSSVPFTPTALKPIQNPLKRKRADTNDIVAQRDEMFREEGCALTLSDRSRDTEPQKAIDEIFEADTVIGITRFVFY